MKVPQIRQRLKFSDFAHRCAEMRHKAMIERKPIPELQVTYDEFMDLRMDMAFNNFFQWASATQIPTEFTCYGVRCVIKGRVNK